VDFLTCICSSTWSLEMSLSVSPTAASAQTVVNAAKMSIISSCGRSLIFHDIAKRVWVVWVMWEILDTVACF
jgi:hypothetical protein